MFKGVKSKNQKEGSHGERLIELMVLVVLIALIVFFYVKILFF
jgi:hypothetical protein